MHVVDSSIFCFQYSNVYMTTPQITKLSQDKDLQEDCLKYVAKSGQYTISIQYCLLTIIDCLSKVYRPILCTLQYNL